MKCHLHLAEDILHNVWSEHIPQVRKLMCQIHEISATFLLLSDFNF